MAKTVILMMDSFGIGGAKDAAAFGDAGAIRFCISRRIIQSLAETGLRCPIWKRWDWRMRASWRPVSVLRWCRGWRK